MFKVIETELGFQVKEFDAKGNSLRIKPEVFATKELALQSFDMPKPISRKPKAKKVTKK
jgi:hypothetical protein